MASSAPSGWCCAGVPTRTGRRDVADGTPKAAVRSAPSVGRIKIRVEHARKSFTQANGAQIEAIRDLSFEVADGEYVAIVGPTGAGKSVFFDCLLGLKELSGGRIEIDGQSVGRYV